MSDIQALIDKIVAFRDARDWKQFHNPKDVALSLVLEAAEVLECFQWKSPQEIDELLRSKKDKVAEEIADVLYWVLLMCHDFGIDPKVALEKKLQQNNEKYPVEKSRGKNSKYTEL